MTFTLHILFPLIGLVVMVVVLCVLFRRYSKARAPTGFAEAIEIYKLALRTAPAFLWVSFLQFLVMAAVCAIFLIPLMLLHIVFFGTIAIDPYVQAPLLIPGLLVLYRTAFLQSRTGIRRNPAGRPCCTVANSSAADS